MKLLLPTAAMAMAGIAMLPVRAETASAESEVAIAVTSVVTTCSSAPAAAKPAPPQLPPPTHAAVAYGAHPMQVMDVWLPEGKGAPTPVVVFVHGGGFANGSRADRRVRDRIPEYRKARIALVSVEYRLLKDVRDEQPPVKACLDDVMEAIRFVRGRASEWNLDLSRLGLTGSSAGACASLYASLTDDNAFGVKVVYAQNPQTSLDPKEMREWIPNSKYGARLFGYPDFQTWLDHRDEVLPWIERFSPMCLLKRCAPSRAPAFIHDGPAAPPPGELAKDPTHSGTFREKFEEICVARGISCRFGHHDAFVSMLKDDTPHIGKTAAKLKPKALVVMLDGMRADAVENAEAPNLRMLRDGRWQPGYTCAWSMNAHTIYDAPTVSGPNHIAIATGVTAEKHTVKSNGKCTCDFTKWPSWLVRVLDAKPDMKALFMFSWGWDKQISPDPRVEFIYGSDAVNAVEMPKRLAAPDVPDALMWYINYPDHGGHGFGYYPYTIGYLNTVYLADKAIGDALAAIAARPAFKDEDWLIVVTADHGGYWSWHGSRGGHCETIPFLVAGRNVTQGRIPGIPRNFDAAPSVLSHFGIDWSGFGLDGKAEGGKTVSDVPRRLADGLAVYMPFDGKAPAALANAAQGDVTAEARGTASFPGKGGFIGGCLRLSATTNGTGSVCLNGSEKLAFENGSEFAMALWVRMQKAQKDDPVVVANKDWQTGANPGILLSCNNTMIKKKVDGMCFNAGAGGPGARIDIGPFDIGFGMWTFYAVTRGPDGVLNFYQGGRDGYLYRIALDATDIRIASGLPFCIGQDGTGKYPAAFNGDVDDFAIWTRALPHGDVRRIYEAGRKGIPLGDLL